jgi:hypothetical protein
MDCPCITIPLSTRMDKIERKLVDHGAATFGNYLRRVSRLARFEEYNKRRNKQKKSLEKARQRAINQIKDRTDIAVAAHTLCYLKTDSISSIDFPLAPDQDVLPLLSTRCDPSLEDRQ